MIRKSNQNQISRSIDNESYDTNDLEWPKTYFKRKYGVKFIKKIL